MTNMENESFEIGRILGGTSRRSNVARRVRELAETKRKKPSEIIEEAIMIYEMVENFANVDTRCLVLGLHFANKVLENAINVLGGVAKLFTSEMVSHYLGAIMKGYEVAKESNKETQTIPQDLRQSISQTITPIITLATTLLTNLISAMTTSLTYTKTTPTQVTPTTSSGVKIE